MCVFPNKNEKQSRFNFILFRAFAFNRHPIKSLKQEKEDYDDLDKLLLLSYHNTFRYICLGQQTKNSFFQMF